jgi:hypothetical protein
MTATRTLLDFKELEFFGGQGRQNAGRMLAERQSTGRMPEECYQNAD